MAGNLKALSPEEFDYLNQKYKFELSGDNIIVTTDALDRKVLHSINEPFSINTPIRRVSFSQQAIDLWVGRFRKNFTLLEVQNAISILTVTYQEVSPQEIEKQMVRKDARIKIQ